MMFDLYRQNLPCKKAYAVVSKGDKFLVLDTPAKNININLQVAVLKQITKH